MDKKLKKLALQETDKEDLLDRLRAHLSTGGERKLTARDSDTLAKLTRIDEILRDNKSVAQCNQALQQEMGLSQAHAYKLINQSLELFGDIRQSRKKSKAYILDEMYMRAANRCWDEGDMLNYLKACDSLARINGLFEADATNINITQLNMPELIILDNDPEILQLEKQAAEIAEDES